MDGDPMNFQIFKIYLEHSLANLDEYKVTIAEFYLLRTSLPTSVIDQLVMNIWNKDVEKFYSVIQAELPEEVKRDSVAWYNFMSEFNILKQIEYKLAVIAFREYRSAKAKEPIIDKQWGELMIELQDLIQKKKLEKKAVAI